MSQQVQISSKINNLTKEINEATKSKKTEFGHEYEAKLFKDTVIIQEMVKSKWKFEDKQDLFNRMSKVRERACKNVVQPMGYIEKDESSQLYGIIHEKFECTLEDFLFKKEETSLKKFDLNLELKYKIAIQMANSVYNLHELGIVHQRIELKYFYLDKNCDVYLGEYYLPKECPKMMLDGRNIGKDGDIVALGMCLYQLFSEEKYNMESTVNPICPRFFKKAQTVGLPKEERKQKAKEIESEELYQLMSKNISANLEELLMNSWSVYAIDRLTAVELMNRLADCALMHQIGSFWGTDFWIHCTKINGSIPDTTLPLEDMLIKLSESTMIDYEEVENVKCLFSQSETLTAKEFGRVLFTFGNFIYDKELLLSMIEFAQSDYYNDCSKEVAQTLLNNTVDLTFLIRPSTTDPKFPFTLSKRAKGKTVHARIEKIENGFMITSGGKKYSAGKMTELVALMKKENIVGNPCPKEVNDDNYG